MNKQSKFRVILLVSGLIFGLLIVNKTQAWLLGKTEPRTNQFTVGKITHVIKEEFDNTIKTNVRIANTGNTEAFVRVKIMPQWLDETGTSSLGLVADNTYEIGLNRVDWYEREGFWYHRQPVIGGAETAVLVKSAQPMKSLNQAYEGKVFNLQVVAQSVQSTPKEAVTELWGFEPNKN